MNELYRRAASVVSADVMLEGVVDRSEASGSVTMRAIIDYFDQDGMRALGCCGEIEVLPTSATTATLTLRGPLGARERIGTTNEGRVPDPETFERQLASLLLAREVGIDPRRESARDLSAVASLASSKARLTQSPELIAAHERVLWDDTWYSSDLFAPDFQELGGDPSDGQSLAEFTQERMAEDYELFCSLSDRCLEGCAAVMAHEVSGDGHPAWELRQPQPTLAAALTRGAVGRALDAAASVRVTDVAGELHVSAHIEGADGAKQTRDFELRSLSAEQLDRVIDVVTGFCASDSLSGVWSEASLPNLSRMLESRDIDRSVAEERSGNETLRSQGDSARSGTPSQSDRTLLDAKREAER